jgi:hypothetical protein
MSSMTGTSAGQIVRRGWSAGSSGHCSLSEDGAAVRLAVPLVEAFLQEHPAEGAGK